MFYVFKAAISFLILKYRLIRIEQVDLPHLWVKKFNDCCAQSNLLNTVNILLEYLKYSEYVDAIFSTQWNTNCMENSSACSILFQCYWHEHAALQSVGLRAADWQRR